MKYKVDDVVRVIRGKGYGFPPVGYVGTINTVQESEAFLGRDLLFFNNVFGGVYDNDVEPVKPQDLIVTATPTEVIIPTEVTGKINRLESEGPYSQLMVGIECNRGDRTLPVSLEQARKLRIGDEVTVQLVVKEASHD